MDLNCLAGCSRVSIVMTIESTPNESVRLLPGFEVDESALDIIVDLMVCERAWRQKHCIIYKFVHILISRCQGYSRVIKVIQFLPVYTFIITR